MGPLFLLFAFLHACLNGTPSALMGSVAAVSAAVFLVCLGNTSITSAQVLYKYNGSDNATTLGLSLPYLSTSLAESLLCCLAIAMLLALWDYYWRLPEGLNRKAPLTLFAGCAVSSLHVLAGGYCRRPSSDNLSHSSRRRLRGQHILL